MKTFLVKVHEIHTQCVLVEAEDFESAKAIIVDGGGSYVNNPTEHLRTCDSDEWEEAEYPEITFFKCKVCGYEETDGEEKYGLVSVKSTSPFGEWAASDCACPRCSEKKQGDGYLMMIAHGENNRPILF